MITAAEMARQVGVDPKSLRSKLRAVGLTWHQHGKRWEMEEGSVRHQEVKAVLDAMRTRARVQVRAAGSSPGQVPQQKGSGERSREDSDEMYVVGLCDRILGQVAVPQATFPWLLGDGARPSRLEVDAYYPALSLVVEYHELQHSRPVAHFDKPGKLTVSGVHRREQRRLYDQRRRDLIPRHGLRLVEIDYRILAHRQNGRLHRDQDHDEAAIKPLLQAHK